MNKIYCSAFLVLFLIWGFYRFNEPDTSGEVDESASRSIKTNINASPQSISSRIAAANIPPDVLQLVDLDLEQNAQEFVEEVSKLVQLKTLRLGHVRHITASQLIEMCKPLKNLTEMFFFRFDLQMSNNELLELIKNAEKLEKFQFYTVPWRDDQRTALDAATYNKLVQIVKQRSEGTKLKVFLGAHAFIAAADLPKELTDAGFLDFVLP